ncbi:BTB/POZ domain-containing protein 1-like [Paramacrobiotus metropolitanus]|uniref:BTB/POZ domain-containing protein 1-like n=1 Tax=Paramacrobiotus metropolitanus TaxID=2943436 RepID=UPI002445BD30|nr:BTB/POZ domain-containing protein 1-like [Paramacrobiotus metropolitanus]
MSKRHNSSPNPSSLAAAAPTPPLGNPQPECLQAPSSTSSSTQSLSPGMDFRSVFSPDNLNSAPLDLEPRGGGTAALPSWGWQGSKNSVLERLQFLLGNNVLSDVTFIVGKEGPVRMPAHKFVLTMGSTVFDAMFNGPLATKEKEIHLPDIEHTAFATLLKFLYTDELGDITHYSVMTTLYVAKKYAVPALQAACVQFLKNNLCPSNAFLLVTQARLFAEMELANLCLEMIDKHTGEAITAEGFLELDHETLCSVLERDTLHIRENKLFQAADKWAEHECVRQGKIVDAARKREVLANALELIRFPVMSIEEFALGPAQSGLLSDKEVKELFLYFTLNPKPETRFVCMPRSCVAGKEYVCNRFQATDSRWGYSGTADRIRFTVDRQIYVMGLGLYGSVHGPAEYSVSLQIILSSNQRVVAQHDNTFSSDGTEAVFRVMFKKPVEIMAQTHYTISACLKGPDSHYGTRGARKVTKVIGKDSSVTFNFIYSPGNNNGTSVEDGQIPEIIFYTV